MIMEIFLVQLKATKKDLDCI